MPERINYPQPNDIWYTKIRIGENTIGNIMKTIASSLRTNKKLTNHSMRKTLLPKLKNVWSNVQFTRTSSNVLCDWLVCLIGLRGFKPSDWPQGYNINQPLIPLISTCLIVFIFLISLIQGYSLGICSSCHLC